MSVGHHVNVGIDCLTGSVKNRKCMWVERKYLGSNGRARVLINLCARLFPNDKRMIFFKMWHVMPFRSQSFPAIAMFPLSLMDHAGSIHSNTT
jgi:hypothetical protein